MYQQILDRQSIINKINNTDDTAEIRFEQVLVSENRKIGGSMDIFVLFSDNTAAIYDIKTIWEASKVKDGVINKYYEIDNDRKDKYKLQLGEYRKQLITEIGVKDVVIQRIIPIIGVLNKDGDISLHNKKETGLLDNIIVGKESIGISSVDNWLKERFALDIPIS